MERRHDEAAVQSLVDLFTEGWNTRDGAACARPFAADADFTAITGLKVHGRELIARGHDEILSTVFRGTRLSATVESIRFIRDDVAVADVTFRLLHEDGRPFVLGKYPGYSTAGLVATKEGDAWSIAVFRNMVPFERPMAGPLERSLMGDATSPGGKAEVGL